jgi:Zn-dependent protease
LAHRFKWTLLLRQIGLILDVILFGWSLSKLCPVTSHEIQSSRHGSTSVFFMLGPCCSLVLSTVLFCFRSMSCPRCCVILFSFYVLTPVLCYFVFVLCLVPGVVLFCFRSISWPRCCQYFWIWHCWLPFRCSLKLFSDWLIMENVWTFSSSLKRMKPKQLSK